MDVTAECVLHEGSFDEGEITHKMRRLLLEQAVLLSEKSRKEITVDELSILTSSMTSVAAALTQLF